MEWTNDEVLEFLGLYEAHPAIWNPRHRDHRNRNIVHDAWKAIESKLSIKTDITEMKKKKDSLMATYRKLLNKVRVSKGTGSGTNDVFKPDWFAYNAMVFLHGVYEAKKTISTEQLENSLDGSEMTSEDTSGQFHESSEMDVPQNLDNNFKSPSVKVTKKRKADDKVEQIENRMDEAFNFLKQISQTPAKSKCSLFTDLLCVKLQGLSEQKQDIAMMEIDNIMFRLKHSADQIVQPPSYYQYPSTSFPTYSPYLLNDNYSTAASSSSSSASLQPQPSPDYISSMPSTYYDLSQNQNSSEYSTSMSSPHFQEFQNPSPTPSQYSNVGEKSLD